MAESAYGLGPESNHVTVGLVPNPPLYEPTIVLPPTAHKDQEVTFSSAARNNLLNYTAGASEIHALGEMRDVSPSAQKARPL